MDETKELLTMQLAEDIRALSTLKGDEKTAAVENIAKLYKLKIEEIRIDVEKEAKRIELENQHNEKVSELQNSKRDKYIQYAITGASSLSGMAFCWICLRNITKFEETGVYRSSAFRILSNSIGRLFKL